MSKKGEPAMKSFNYIIKDEIGIHARPAGMLVKAAKELASKVTITCDGKTAEATKLMALIALGVKCGSEITVTVEGADEEEAVSVMEKFFNENL